MIVAFVRRDAGGARRHRCSACWPAFFGGWIDTLVSRLVDIWMSFPPVLLSIVLVAVIGTGLKSVIACHRDHRLDALLPRRARPRCMVQRACDYVTVGAHRSGNRARRMLWREILPNVAAAPARACSALEMGIAVVVEAILSFVGLSVSSDMPTWGGLVAGRPPLCQPDAVAARPADRRDRHHRARLQRARRRPARIASTRCCADEQGPLPRSPWPARGAAAAPPARATLILRGIDLQIAAGEVHALVGESGAGKSMVGRTVLGITPPGLEVVAGSVRFLGLDWLAPDAGRAARACSAATSRSFRRTR